MSRIVGTRWRAARPSQPRQVRRSQNRQHFGGRDTANASAFQDPGDARLTDARRLVGRRHELPFPAKAPRPSAGTGMAAVHGR
jgi:hypothetical protein